MKNCKCEHIHKENCDCGCEHEHHHEKKNNTHGYLDKKTGLRMCVLEDGVVCDNCGACDMCDLDPNKVCDNCGKCLDTLNTDDKGYVSVPVDKIIMEDDDISLEQLLAMYGLDKEDEDQ